MQTLSTGPTLRAFLPQGLNLSTGHTVKALPSQVQSIPMGRILRTMSLQMHTVCTVHTLKSTPLKSRHSIKDPHGGPLPSQVLTFSEGLSLKTLSVLTGADTQYRPHTEGPYPGR